MRAALQSVHESGLRAACARYGAGNRARIDGDARRDRPFDSAWRSGFDPLGRGKRQSARDRNRRGQLPYICRREGQSGNAAAILRNAKMQRPSVCNAAETLLVHKDVAADFCPWRNARWRLPVAWLRTCGGDSARHCSGNGRRFRHGIQRLYSGRARGGFAGRSHCAHRALHHTPFRSHRHRRCGAAETFMRASTRRRCTTTLPRALPMAKNLAGRRNRISTQKMHAEVPWDCGKSVPTNISCGARPGARIKGEARGHVDPQGPAL